MMSRFARAASPCARKPRKRQRDRGRAAELEKSSSRDHRRSTKSGDSTLCTISSRMSPSAAANLSSSDEPRAALGERLAHTAREPQVLAHEAALRGVAVRDRLRELGQRRERRARVGAEPLDVVHVAAGVDRLAVLGLAPAADRIEVLEAEADPVDVLVAVATAGIARVHREALARRRVRIDLGHATAERRRRRQLLAQEVAANEQAALDRRGLIGVRGRREHRGVTEQAGALAVGYVTLPVPLTP